MTDSKISVDEKLISDSLGTITVHALTLILRKLELPRGYYSRPEIVKNIVQYVQDERLDLNFLVEEVRLIQEGSSKVIFLREIVDKSILKDTSKLRALLKSKLPGQKSEGKETVLFPNDPILNYSEVTETEVRLKFSETHTNVKFSVAKRDFEEIKHTNVIVFSVNRNTGNARLYMDTPWNEHPYRNEGGNYTKDSYFKHHHKRFSDLFGENTSINLTQRVSDLVRAKNPICVPKVDSGINDANNKRTLSGEDLSGDEEYTSLSHNRIIEYTNLNFLADRSQTNLLDDVNVVVHPIEGRIHILAERLPNEVDYVISAITKI